MAVALKWAREKMVAEQIRGRGISDSRVIEAMLKVPRHRFVEEALWERAYDDKPLPIGEKQTISQPYMVGLMSEALELKGEEKVLEVGTGSGYQAAILAELAKQVYSIERLAELAKRARTVLDDLGYDRVAIRVGDGSLGWPEEAPFDAIIVTAAGPRVPRPLVEQLAERGRLVFPIGELEVQTLVKIRKIEGRLVEEYLGGCRFVKLIGSYGWEE